MSSELLIASAQPRMRFNRDPISSDGSRPQSNESVYFGFSVQGRRHHLMIHLASIERIMHCRMRRQIYLRIL
jgi:hypothetical protein